jgi:predicted transcriptional regulator
MSNKKIAEKFNISPMMVSYLMRGARHTTDHKLAIEISKHSGKAPIYHIALKMRKLYLRLYPELKKRNGKNR